MTLSVHRLLFSMSLQNDTGTSAQLMHGAVLLSPVKKLLRVALRSFSKPIASTLQTPETILFQQLHVNKVALQQTR